MSDLRRVPDTRPGKLTTHWNSFSVVGRLGRRKTPVLQLSQTYHPDMSLGHFTTDALRTVSRPTDRCRLEWFLSWYTGLDNTGDLEFKPTCNFFSTIDLW